MHQQQTAFENTVGKGEIARNEQFLLFPQRFLFNQIIVSPFAHIFDSSKLKEFADDNFELDESGKKFSKWLENTVGKGEIGKSEKGLRKN